MAEPSRNTPYEQQFAWLAVEAGLVPIPVMTHAMADAADRRRSGEAADVRSVLAEERVLDREDMAKVLQRMAAIPMVCPACRTEYLVRWQPSPRRCPADSETLAPTLAPPSSVGTRRREAVKSTSSAKHPVVKITPGRQPLPTRPPSGRHAGAGAATTPDTAAPVEAKRGSSTERQRAAQALVGKLFGNYRLAQLIQRNSKSLVFRARIDGRDDDFAVKILLVDDESMRRRMLREGQYITRIAHRNVIDAIEVGGVDRYLYLAMEFVDGPSLQQALAERAMLAVPEAVNVGIGVLDGLAAAHEAGVVHRDMKPGNIMIGPDGADGSGGSGAVKILDFGMSRLMDTSIDYSTTNLTELGTVLGTPDYIAPEQLRTSKVDHRADLWSAGATLYHALTGEVPYTGRGQVDNLVRRMKEDPAPPSSHVPTIPAALDAVILKLMARTPADRYQDAATAAGDLRRVRDDPGV